MEPGGRDSYDELVNEGFRLQEQGDVHGARQIWRRLAQMRPNATVLLFLAKAATELDELDEAQQSLLKAIELDSSCRPAYVLLCNIAFRKGAWGEGEAYARQALAIEKGPDAYCQIGLALNRLGKREEARESFQRGLEADAEFAQLYYHLGEMVSRSNPAEAEVLFEKAIELNPDYALAHSEMGSLLLDEAEMLDAEYHLRRAIELDPADPWPRLHLGNLLWRKGDLAGAVVETQWAHAAAPDLPCTLWSLADIYSAKEEWAKAEAFYKRALALAPDDVCALKGLGRMYLSIGRTDLAKISLGRALFLHPEDKRAFELLEQANEGYDDLPKNLVQRMQRRRSRWEMRQDPGSP